MSGIRVVAYTEEFFDEWNAFVEASSNGTVFHRLDFLAYHRKGKFNFHHLLFFRGDTLVAVLPAGLRGDTLRSPMGSSFGGFVVPPFLGIETADEIVKALIRYCASRMIKEIFITPPMQIYHDVFNEAVDYSLHYNHFVTLSSLYSSIIDFSRISGKESLSRNTRHKINKAINKGIRIVQENDFDTFYPILLKNKKKFSARPTHTLAELKRIDRLLPGMITMFLAYYGNEPVGGEVLFRANRRCILNFYTMHLYEYRNLFAVNYLIEHSIRWSREQGFRYLDYGVSADTFSTDPMEPSWSLIQFKESMGSTGCARKSYYRRVF